VRSGRESSTKRASSAGEDGGTDLGACGGVMLRNGRIVLVALALGCASCAFSSYQGAVIDARDFMHEGRYRSALRELDRAKESPRLTAEQRAEIAELEERCREARAQRGRIVLSADADR
jgi:hypothetical protein